MLMSGTGMAIAVFDLSDAGGFGETISRCVETAVACPVATWYGGGRELRSLFLRRRIRKKRMARSSARPIIETGTAIAIFVLFDGPPEKVLGSLVAVWVGVTTEVEVEVEVITELGDVVEVSLELDVADLADNGYEEVNVGLSAPFDVFHASIVEDAG
jgi:hypothetical protein